MGEFPIIWNEIDPVALETKALIEKCVLHKIGIPYLQLLPRQKYDPKGNEAHNT